MKSHHHTDERLLIEQFVESGKASAQKLFDDAQALRSHLDAGFRVSTHQFLQAMKSQEARAREVEERVASMEKVKAEQTSLKMMVNTVLGVYNQQVKETRTIEEHLKNYGYREEYHDLPPQFYERLGEGMDDVQVMQGGAEAVGGFVNASVVFYFQYVFLGDPNRNAMIRFIQDTVGRNLERSWRNAAWPDTVGLVRFTRT